jgi:DNA topoisomerase-3
MNATRLYTVKHGGYKQVLSVGQVQTPTLAMVVDRYAAIEILNRSPIGSYRLYIETSFVMKKAVFKRKTENS